MTVNQMEALVKKLREMGHGEKEMTYLCPDGYNDSIELAFVIEENNIEFGSYIHRQKYPRYLDLPKALFPEVK